MRTTFVVQVVLICCWVVVFGGLPCLTQLLVVLRLIKYIPFDAFSCILRYKRE